jgi:futalosine hydrolase
MSRRILLVTATETEAGSIRKISSSGRAGVAGNYEIHFLVTGVGSVPCAWSMMNWFSLNGKPDLAINAGIAGSFREDIHNGEVVMPENECFADYGIEDGNEYLTLSEAGLGCASEFPFSEGYLMTDPLYHEKLKNVLRPVKAITRGTATGAQQTVDMLVRRFDPDIETMEGASFFYICKRESIPFFAVRSISNRVERRNRASWNIPLALENLSVRMEEVFNLLE